MLATQTYNFLFFTKLQLQLQFYFKTHKETNTEKVTTHQQMMSCALIRFFMCFVSFCRLNRVNKLK